MMKLPLVLGGIVRAIVIILLRRKPREQQSLRLEFPKATVYGAEREHYKRRSREARQTKTDFGKIYPSENIPPAPWANQYNINTTHDSFMVAITVPIVTAKKIVRSKHV